MFKFFSANQKTEVSYDFGICPLMKKNKQGKFVALCGVDKCYSARLLNVRKNLGLKLEDLENRKDLIAYELMLVNAMALVDPDFILRGFSFSDYMEEHEDAFLQIVDGYKGRRHIAISKNLWLQDKIELIQYVGSKIELSLGFTKQLYPRFKKWFKANRGLPFSLAYTYNNISEFEWLKETDIELFNLVDVFHDADIHSRVPQLDRVGKTPKHQKIIDGFKRNHSAHLQALADIDGSAVKKMCNVYGDVKKVKKCRDCNGCAVRSRFNTNQGQGSVTV